MSIVMYPVMRQRMQGMVNRLTKDKAFTLSMAIVEASNRLQVEFNADPRDIADAYMISSAPATLDRQRRAYAKFRLAHVDCHKGLE